MDNTRANYFREKPDFSKINKKRTYGSGDINFQAKYLIKNFIPVNSTVGFYGPSGHCKSFLALSVAAHISVGLDWNGNKTSKSAVLYISAEGGNGIHSRIRGWEKRYNNGMKLNNFRVVTDGVILSDEADQEQIWLMCQEVMHDTGLSVGLIVIDTVARCLDGDESSARDMGSFIRGADKIRTKTGATVLLIHHTGKSIAKGARGSSAFSAAMDAEFCIRRESKREDNFNVILKCTKFKDLAAHKEVVFEHDLEFIGFDDDGEPLNTLVTKRFSRELKDSTTHELTGNLRVLMGFIKQMAADSGVADKSSVRKLYNSSNFSRDLKQLVGQGVYSHDNKSIYIIEPQKV